MDDQEPREIVLLKVTMQLQVSVPKVVFRTTVY